MKMKKSYILPLFAAAILATGCSKEDPFNTEEYGTGQFLKSALSVDLNADGVEYRQTRAEANVDDFTVIFTKEGESQPAAKYLYGEMPEIVTLPAGTYTCTATYGENRVADWENPYFLGKSAPFEVHAMEITSYVDPIICNLENIKVTVGFDNALKNHMSGDSYVEVKVGTSTALSYGIAEAEAEKAGYFMHSEEKTLVAVFHGTVDGNSVVETKSMKDIQKGAHYKINFKLHNGSESDMSGDADLGIAVEADVEVVDVNRNVSLGEEELLDDSERPTESEKPGDGEDPEGPDQPGPGEEQKEPLITADAPVNLEVVNNGVDLATCVLHIYSYDDAGIQELTCQIVSEPLQEVLEPMGLSDNLDLAETPESMKETLGNMGFPTSVRGQKDVRFEITPMFLEMLGDLGSYEHHFILKVKDANGECTKTLKLKY